MQKTEMGNLEKLYIVKEQMIYDANADGRNDMMQI